MDTHKQSFWASIALRWGVSSLGLWVASGLFSDSVNIENKLSAVLLAGAVLAFLNTILKPLLVLMSVPFIVTTLGLFMIVINGITVYLASLIYDPLHIAGFGTAVITGLVIGLVNYLVTAIIDR
jgi:putative membrane protein